MSTSNFQRAVKEALLNLANKIDTSGAYNSAKSDYYDVVISSMNRIADNYEVPVPELPSVTGADEGKVLTVDDEGRWVAGEGGGGGVLVIHIQNNVLDKTWKEIYDHMAAGGIAMCLLAESEDSLSVRQIFPTSCEQDPYDSEFYVYFEPQSFPAYKATSADGYPSMSLG